MDKCRLLAAASAAFLCVVLATSGIEKLIRPVDAANAVLAYEIVPWQVASILAPLIAALEIALGAALLMIVLRRCAAMLSTALLALFAAGQAQALVRGITADCGCGGAKDAMLAFAGVENNLSFGSIVITSALAGMAGLLAFMESMHATPREA